MNKTMICLLALLLAAGGVFAQSRATVREATGKVELQASGGAWVPARVGAVVSLGTTISTGFNSTAVLDLGTSVLKVNPLTRMRLDQLVQQGGAVQTELFLRVGKVNAEVKTVAGVTQDFKLKSPVSTAAVRGTGFDYTGYDVVVTDGTVTYLNSFGQSRDYTRGEGGGTDGHSTPAPGEDSKSGQSGVDPYTAGAGGQAGSGLGVGAGLTGTITVFVPAIE
jgi:hypothetical protein